MVEQDINYQTSNPAYPVRYGHECVHCTNNHLSITSVMSENLKYCVIITNDYQRPIGIS